MVIWILLSLVPYNTENDNSKVKNLENSPLNYDDIERGRSQNCAGCLFVWINKYSSETGIPEIIGQNTVGRERATKRVSSSTFTTSQRATPSPLTPPSAIPLPSISTPTGATRTPKTDTPVPHRSATHTFTIPKSRNTNRGEGQTCAYETDVIDKFFAVPCFICTRIIICILGYNNHPVPLAGRGQKYISVKTCMDCLTVDLS